MKEIKVYRTSNPKQKPDYSTRIRKYFTDHMFLMDYSSAAAGTTMDRTVRLVS